MELTLIIATGCFSWEDADKNLVLKCVSRRNWASLIFTSLVFWSF